MRHNGKPVHKPPLAILAATLKQIAEMDALLRVPFPQRPKEEPPMRDLNYDLKQLCRPTAMVATPPDQLHEKGFRHMDAHSLKPKHVEQLVERWLAEKLSAGTMKNRMTALRWWAEKIGKENVVARTNAAYAIPDRVYVTNVSKAKELDFDKLEQIRDVFIQISLRLQAEFGLRREESIKIVPKWADRGNCLVLKESWTKVAVSVRFPSAPSNNDSLSMRRRNWPRARASSQPAIPPTATI